MTNSCNNLSKMSFDLLFYVHSKISEIAKSLLHIFLKRLSHFILDRVQPCFDLSPCWRLLFTKWNFFTFSREHRFDCLCVFFNFETIDVIETSFKMLLNYVEILRVCKDLEQLVIRQKIKPREFSSFIFKDSLLAFSGYHQAVHYFNLSCSRNSNEVLVFLLHLEISWSLPSELWRTDQLFRIFDFLLAVAFDIWSFENIFEVNLLLLAHNSFFNQLVEYKQCLFQKLGFIFERLYKAKE